MTSKITFSITFVIAMLLGCSAIKQKTIQDDLEEITDNVAQEIFDQNNLVQVACDSDELFAVLDLDAPGAEACASVVPNDAERVVIYEAAKCIKENGTSGPELLECLSAIDGLIEFAEKLSDTAAAQ